MSWFCLFAHNFNIALCSYCNGIKITTILDSKIHNLKQVETDHGIIVFIEHNLKISERIYAF